MIDLPTVFFVNLMFTIRYLIAAFIPSSYVLAEDEVEDTKPAKGTDTEAIQRYGRSGGEWRR